MTLHQTSGGIPDPVRARGAIPLPHDEARELDPKADHQLKVEFGDGQFWVTLLCPESGCIPAWDAPDGGDECWLKGWAEASVIDEGLVGEVIVAVSTSWDGDGPVSKIVADAQLVEWRERAQKAEAERDEARKLLDELCEIVNDVHYPGRLTTIGGLLRERHASWPGWKR